MFIKVQSNSHIFFALDIKARLGVLIQGYVLTTYLFISHMQFCAYKTL